MSTKSIPGIGTATKQDHAFGATMLTLRTKIGFTQARLSEYLGISRRAVGEWEAGNSYPKPGHLKAIIALAVKCYAFHAGHEAEEVRAFWRAAHAKVLLDEHWLAGLLDGSALQSQVNMMSAEDASSYWKDEAWMERSIALYKKVEKRHG